MQNNILSISIHESACKTSVKSAFISYKFNYLCSTNSMYESQVNCAELMLSVSFLSHPADMHLGPKIFPCVASMRLSALVTPISPSSFERAKPTGATSSQPIVSFPLVRMHRKGSFRPASPDTRTSLQ